MKDAVLWLCFQHHVFRDAANAALHVAPVRYSTLTVTIAEAIADDPPPNPEMAALRALVLERGEPA